MKSWQIALLVKPFLIFAAVLGLKTVVWLVRKLPESKVKRILLS